MGRIRTVQIELIGIPLSGLIILFLFNAHTHTHTHILHIYWCLITKEKADNPEKIKTLCVYILYIYIHLLCKLDEPNLFV